MRKKGIFIAILLYCYIAIWLYGYMVIWFASPAFAQAVPQELPQDRVIVRFKEPQAMGYKVSQMLNQGVELKEKLLLDNTFVFQVKKGQAEAVASNLAKDPEIEYAEPDYVIQAHGIPNDPYFEDQWGLSEIEAARAWDLTRGSSEVKIAILDTGTAKDHPDLSPKVEQWVDFTGSSTEEDLDGHGTRCAGIAAAVTNNGVGIAGAGYDTHLLSVKVLAYYGLGLSSWLVNGIVWAADNGAKVINISIGFREDSAAVREAVTKAWQKGVVLVASAGNCGKGCDLNQDEVITDDEINPIFYPAAYEKVIAVTGYAPNNDLYYHSNYGTWISVAAPAEPILSTVPGGGYDYLSATSMAAPFVSGVAGLLFSVNPSLSTSQVRSLIEENADKVQGTGTYWAHGRINAYRSVLAATGGGPTATPIPTGEPTLTPIPTVPPTPTPTPVPPGCPAECLGGVPSRREGNANCDEIVDEEDYLLWKEQFEIYAQGEQIVKEERTADFSCQEDVLETQKVDLADFEFWRRNYSNF